MSDVLILSLPMHNFGIPVSLKAWIDQVVRPGRTFDRSESGKVGLLADRPVFIIVTSGGPVGGEYGQTEFISSYLKYVLPTIGLKDIRLLFLDSMLRNEAHMQAQMNQGHAWIADQVALPFPVFEPA
jgi:FMN-dependent NADH-azoreductase